MLPAVNARRVFSLYLILVTSLLLSLTARGQKMDASGDDQIRAVIVLVRAPIASEIRSGSYNSQPHALADRSFAL
jgi:uncharacterized membrane protein